MSKILNDYFFIVGSFFKGILKVCFSLKFFCVFIIWIDFFKYIK